MSVFDFVSKSCSCYPQAEITVNFSQEQWTEMLRQYEGEEIPPFKINTFSAERGENTTEVFISSYPPFRSPEGAAKELRRRALWEKEKREL